MISVCHKHKLPVQQNWKQARNGMNLKWAYSICYLQILADSIMVIRMEGELVETSIWTSVSRTMLIFQQDELVGFSLKPHGHNDFNIYIYIYIYSFKISSQMILDKSVLKLWFIVREVRGTNSRYQSLFWPQLAVRKTDWQSSRKTYRPA